MKRKELLEMCSQIVGAAKRLSNGIVVRPLYKCHATTYERADMAVEVDRWSGKRTKLPKETEHEIRNELDYEPLITSRWEE